MASSSSRGNFLLLWMFLPSLCASVAAAIVIAASSLKLLELAVLVYWIVLGLLQWKVLKSQASWAYQWGVVTLVGGIASQWISSLFMVFLSTLEDQKLQVQLLGKFLTQPGLTLLEVCFSSSFMLSARGFAFLIFPFFACLVGGIFLGWIQWLVLRRKLPFVGNQMPVVSGVAWLLGPASVFMLIVGFDGGLPSGFQLFLTYSIAFSLCGMVGSFLKGVVLIRLLAQSSTQA